MYYLNQNELSFVDSVVMLTFSDWFTEARSNRYHYATRFARLKRVIFVQPDLNQRNFKIIESDIPNLTILSVFKVFGPTQSRIIRTALHQMKIKQPLYWVYGALYNQYLSSIRKEMTVYHATEDYISPDSDLCLSVDNYLLKCHLETLSQSDLMICVSKGVHESYKKYSNYNGPFVVVSNGCDSQFYALRQPEIVEQVENPPHDNVVFFQGTIFSRLNFDLLHSISNRLTDWIFRFCGKVVKDETYPKWQALLQQANVEYLGVLTPQEIREQSKRCTVGIIPFVDSGSLVRSAPLKAYEYIATGLPVVTTPIDHLEGQPELFRFATTGDEFVAGILDSLSGRYDEEKLIARVNAAKAQCYDIKFAEAISSIVTSYHLKRERQSQYENLNVILVYSPRSCELNLLDAFVESMKQYSKHSIYTIPFHKAHQLKLDDYDVLIASPYYPSSQRDRVAIDSFASDIRAYGGLSLYLDFSTPSDKQLTLYRSLGYQFYCNPFDSTQIIEMNHVQAVTNEPISEFNETYDVSLSEWQQFTLNLDGVIDTIIGLDYQHENRKPIRIQTLNRTHYSEFCRALETCEAKIIRRSILSKLLRLYHRAITGLIFLIHALTQRLPVIKRLIPNRLKLLAYRFMR